MMGRGGRELRKWLAGLPGVEYHGHVTALDAEQHANEGTADE
jgi:hypothetical protein